MPRRATQSFAAEASGRQARWPDTFPGPQGATCHGFAGGHTAISPKGYLGMQILSDPKVEIVA